MRVSLVVFCKNDRCRCASVAVDLNVANSKKCGFKSEGHKDCQVCFNPVVSNATILLPKIYCYCNIRIESNALDAHHNKDLVPLA